MAKKIKNKPAFQPDWRFVCANPAHFIAFGFGSGLGPVAPGTWGSLAAIPLYALLTLVASAQFILLLCLPLFVLGVWASERASRSLGVSDYGGIVFDEIVGMFMVLALAPASALGWLVAFILFRIFDMLKPWPIRWIDGHVEGGFGVMLDDILAAGFAMAAQAVLWHYVLR